MQSAVADAKGLYQPSVYRIGQSRVKSNQKGLCAQINNYAMVLPRASYAL